MFSEELRNFHNREREVRNELDCYLNMAELKKVLNISYTRIFELIRDGDLPAVKVLGEPIIRAEINQDTRGLRVAPSDVQEYLERQKVK